MKKKHQHFIPQTYLKKFSHTQNKRIYLVDAYDKLAEKYISNVNVYALCAETDLYTLKNLNGPDQYTVENFFSDNVESKYPRIYKLLVEEKKKIISLEERMDILYVILSMYFRTPKVLNEFTAFSAELVENIKNQSKVDEMDFLGHKISLKEKSFQQIKNEIKETNRVNYIQIQLILLAKFVEFKAYDGLVVSELVGDQEFITSDNPVAIGNGQIFKTDLFDVTNSIYVPLNPKHALYIAPSMKGTVINEIFYQRDNFVQHITINHSVCQNAERWIIGTKKGLEQFLKDMEEYSLPSDENHPLMIKVKSKLNLMSNILILAEKGITNENEELLKSLKDLKNNELFNNNIDLQDLFKNFKEHGLNI